MGYTTVFSGIFNFSQQLTFGQQKILIDFSNKRHGNSIKVYDGSPGFWCQWTPTEDGRGLIWDDQEKFYDYIEWLEYLIKNFFESWNIFLNGDIFYRGEDWDDFGKITVNNNIVTRYHHESS